MSTHNIERFIEIGNTRRMNDTQVTKLKEETIAKINNSSVIDSVKNLVSQTISSTIVTNSTNIQQIIAGKNSINFTTGTNCKTGNINLINIDQSNVITGSIIATKNTTIKNDITQDIKNNIINNIKNQIQKVDASKVDASKVSSPGDVETETTGKVINNAACGIGIGIGIGNTCDQTTLNQDEKDIKTTFNLSDDFKLNDSNNVNNVIDNNLNSDSISNIIADISGVNTIELDNLCPTDIDIDTVKQSLTINSVMQSTVISDISNKIAVEYINSITTNVSKIFDKLKSDKDGKIITSGMANLGDNISKSLTGGSNNNNTGNNTGNNNTGNNNNTNNNSNSNTGNNNNNNNNSNNNNNNNNTINMKWIIIGIIVLIFIIILILIIIPKNKSNQINMLPTTSSKYYIHLLKSIL